MHIDRAIRIFRKKCDNAGILLEVRKRQHYEKPCDKRNRLKQAAVRRQEKITEEETRYMKRRPNHWY